MASSRLATLSQHFDQQQVAFISDKNAPLTERPMRVLVTGAAGQIAYALINMIAAGDMLGPKQKVILHLLDIPPMAEKLDGVKMEIQDCAYPLVAGIVAATDEPTAFKDVEIALLVGAMPRRKGMERKDLLKKNASIFKSQGASLDKYSSKNVKVVVVGNPANTNCLIAQQHAPSIPPQNFTALTRLDQNRAKIQLALKFNVTVGQISNVVIWGNHSSTQYPDVSPTMVNGYGDAKLSIPAKALINDQAWIENFYIPCIQQRGAAVIKARKSSSAMSAAKAITNHIHDWMLGTPAGEMVSMAVVSDGSYGVPQGLVYSFPVNCYRGGDYQIVQGLKIDDYSRRMMDATANELLEEKRDSGLL